MVELDISKTTWKATLEGIVPEVDFYECSSCKNGLYIVNGNCETCGTQLVRAENKEASIQEARIDQIIELIQESEAKFSPLEWADSFLSAYRKCIPNGKHFKYSAKVLMLPAFRQYYWLKVIESNDANDEIALDEIVKENSSLEQLHKRRKAGLHVSDLEPQALNREFKKIWDNLEDQFWNCDTIDDLFEKVYLLCGATSNHWLWINIFWSTIWTSSVLRANMLLPEHVLTEKEKDHLKFLLQFKEGLQNIPFEGLSENLDKKNPFSDSEYWRTIREKLEDVENKSAMNSFRTISWRLHFVSNWNDLKIKILNNNDAVLEFSNGKESRRLNVGETLWIKTKGGDEKYTLEWRLLRYYLNKTFLSQHKNINPCQGSIANEKTIRSKINKWFKEEFGLKSNPIYGGIQKTKVNLRFKVELEKDQWKDITSDSKNTKSSGNNLDTFALRNDEHCLNDNEFEKAEERIDNTWKSKRK